MVETVIYKNLSVTISVMSLKRKRKGTNSQKKASSDPTGKKGPPRLTTRRTHDVDEPRGRRVVLRVFGSVTHPHLFRDVMTPIQLDSLAADPAWTRLHITRDIPPTIGFEYGYFNVYGRWVELSLDAAWSQLPLVNMSPDGFIAEKRAPRPRPVYVLLYVFEKAYDGRPDVVYVDRNAISMERHPQNLNLMIKLQLPHRRNRNRELVRIFLKRNYVSRFLDIDEGNLKIAGGGHNAPHQHVLDYFRAPRSRAPGRGAPRAEHDMWTLLEEGGWIYENAAFVQPLFSSMLADQIRDRVHVIELSEAGRVMFESLYGYKPKEVRLVRDNAPQPWTAYEVAAPPGAAGPDDGDHRHQAIRMHALRM